MVLGPQNFALPFARHPDDYVGMQGFSVAVSLPRPLTQALKSLPEIREEARQYFQRGEAQAAKATGAADAINLGIQTVAVAGVFGIIIASLLMREKKGK